jgi:hypothetical protein
VCVCVCERERERERERIRRSVGTWGLGRVVGQGLDKFSGDGINRVNNWSKLHQPYGSSIGLLYAS